MHCARYLTLLGHVLHVLDLPSLLGVSSTYSFPSESLGEPRGISMRVVVRKGEERPGVVGIGELLVCISEWKSN